MSCFPVSVYFYNLLFFLNVTKNIAKTRKFKKLLKISRSNYL